MDCMWHPLVFILYVQGGTCSLGSIVLPIVSQPLPWPVTANRAKETKSKITTFRCTCTMGKGSAHTDLRKLSPKDWFLRSEVEVEDGDGDELTVVPPNEESSSALG